MFTVVDISALEVQFVHHTRKFYGEIGIEFARLTYVLIQIVMLVDIRF